MFTHEGRDASILPLCPTPRNELDSTYFGNHRGSRVMLIRKAVGQWASPGLGTPVHAQG